MTGAITQALKALEELQAEYRKYRNGVTNSMDEATIVLTDKQSKAKQAHADLKKFVEGVPDGLEEAIRNTIVDPSAFSSCKEWSIARHRAAKHLQQGIEE
ncbi:MAG: hypothetical protein ACUZ8E_17680 [Candidatus Anammoxibacter sp.]